MVGRGGLEPPKASASRFTVCPLWPLGYLPACSPTFHSLVKLALAGGFEPPTHCLQGSCSSPELRQQSQNFTLGSRLCLVKAFLLWFLGNQPPLPNHLVTQHSRHGGDVQRVELAPH